MIRVFCLIVSGLFLVGPALAEINVQKVTSEGGIHAWLVQEPSIPIVAFEVAFRGGTSLDTPEKQGATNLMAGLLEEGTGDLDAAGFLRRSEELAAHFTFDASRDQVTVTAEVLRENVGVSMDLFKQAISAPAFNQIAFDRVQGQVLSILRSNSTDPQHIASDALNRLAYPDHPYGRDGEGTLESVSALTPADMHAAHAMAMAKDRMFVTVVGDISAEELGPMLDQVLGDLPDTGAPLPEKTGFAATGGITVVNFQTPQSVAIWAHEGIERDDPDFFAAYVMNHILGGGSFSSRLTQEVREKRGLTYGVYSYLAPYDLTSVAGGSVASANDRIADAVRVIQEEWQKMATEGATEAELDAAKKYLTGAYPLRFDGNSRIASILSGMQVTGLPVDYIKTRNQKVEAVTLEDVNRVAAQILRADAMRFVIVGQPENLTSTE